MSGLSRKAKRRKLGMENDAKMADGGALRAAVRSAKKAARPKKIGIPLVPSKTSKKRAK
jgi:ATP-dependent RNA helicase DDX27